MSKENFDELMNVDPRVYYDSLSKKDKSKLLRFLVGKFGMNYSTAVQKLKGHIEMKQTDVIVFNLAFQQRSEWMQ